MKIKFKKVNKKYFIFGGMVGVVLLVLLAGYFCYEPVFKFVIKNKVEREKHAKYLEGAKNAYEELEQDVNSVILKMNNDDYEGIGIVFLISGGVASVGDVVENSPAEKVGLEFGDRIIKINNMYVAEMAYSDIEKSLKGEKGTYVVLDIYRDSFGNKSKEIVIKRDYIDNSKNRNYANFIKQGIGGTDLGNNYKEYNGKVYYWVEQGTDSRMAKIDLDLRKMETFNGRCNLDDEGQEISYQCDHFAKDDKKVFRNYLEIKGADPETFELMESGNEINYSKDKDSIFSNAYKIEGADRDTFEIISDRYSKDKNSIFFWNNKIEGVDLKTFTITDNNGSMSKDKNNKYRGWKVYDQFQSL